MSAPLTLVPRDDEATRSRAEADALAMLKRGDSRVAVVRARVKLPSGIRGERWYALGEEMLRIFGRPEGTVKVYKNQRAA